MACISCPYGLTYRDSILRPVSHSTLAFINRRHAGLLSNGLKLSRRKRKLGKVCFVVSENAQHEKETESEGTSAQSVEFAENLRKSVENGADKLTEKATKKKAERYTYLFAAVASSLGITSMAAGAVYSRFVWQMQGEDVPFTEMLGTFLFVAGATVGMEFWARWAHRALWHASLWHMHESHHKPREGPFELNDVFAIINAVPAIALVAYGVFNKGLVPGLCFGAGLGITCFGMAYMFVHDGLVHRRFPVGPIADLPYLNKVAAAHKLHHADKFDGVPYGLFLGPQELEEVGGGEELEKLLSSKRKFSTATSENKEAQ